MVYFRKLYRLNGVLPKALQVERCFAEGWADSMCISIEQVELCIAEGSIVYFRRLSRLNGVFLKVE